MEKEIATHSSILAWKSPWTEKPGGLQSRGLRDWACVHEVEGDGLVSIKVVELKKKKFHFLKTGCSTIMHQIFISYPSKKNFRAEIYTIGI